MSQYLASDVANPAFVGAQNPDSMLSKRFFWHEPEDMNKSMELGKLVKGPKQVYISIMVPGDKNSEIVRAMREGDKQRFPQEWLYFAMKEGLIDGAGENLPGWKLEEWEELDADQVRDLQYKRFHVVEQIANASDAQVQGIGMGGLALREKAKRALQGRMGAETRLAMEQKDREMAEMRQQIAALTEMVKASNKPASVPPAETIALTQPTADTTERDSLAVKYAEKFGKKPHHKLGVAKLKEALGE